MSNIIDLRPRLDGRTAERYRRTLEKSQREGGTAWARLRHGNRRLSFPDRVAIASRLEREISSAGLNHSALAASAGFADGGKGVYRCTLPEGAIPEQRRLRAHARDYVRIIEALQHHTKENLHCLVDRLTIGTVVHPMRSDDLSDIQALEALLQQIANRIDQEFGLLDAYRQIAEWRIMHFGRSGWGRWPMHDWEADDITEERIDDEKAYLSRSANAYYDRHHDVVQYAQLSEFDRQEALAYIPSVFLGFRVDWREYREDQLQGRTKDLAGALKNEALAKQWLISSYVDVDMTAWPPIDPEIRQSLGDNSSTWIAIYPDRELRSVIPVLMTNEEEAGTACIELTADNLVRLQAIDIVSTDSVSAFERIQQQAAEGLEEKWTAMGQCLLRHPYLVRAREQAVARSRVRSKLSGRPDGNG